MVVGSRLGPCFLAQRKRESPYPRRRPGVRMANLTTKRGSQCPQLEALHGSGRVRFASSRGHTEAW